MRTSGAGSSLTPTLGTGVSSLPPEGALAPWGGPAALGTPTLGTGVSSLTPGGAPAPASARTLLRWPGGPAALMAPTLVAARRKALGFTLLELLVVVAIIAIATAGVSFALRDSSETQLEREAQRLAALFESARAQSRATGVPVRWRPTADGFLFEGLPPEALPSGWLSEGTVARLAQTTPALLLGPEPIIGAQAVVLSRADQPARALRIGTDGLRPFIVEPAVALPGQP